MLTMNHHHALFHTNISTYLYMYASLWEVFLYFPLGLFRHRTVDNCSMVTKRWQQKLRYPFKLNKLRSPRNMRVCLSGSGKSGVPSDRCFCFLDRRNMTWSNSVPRRRRESSCWFFHGAYIDRNDVGYLLSLSLQGKRCAFRPEFAFSKTRHSNPCMVWMESVIWAS